MLSVSISAPILVINSLLLGIILEKDFEDDDWLLATVITAGCFLINGVFALCVFSKLVLNYDLKAYILIISLAQVAFLVFAILKYGYTVIKNKMKGKKA